MSLIEAAAKLGFQANGVRGPFESLAKVPKPVIAHLKIQITFKHPGRTETLREVSLTIPEGKITALIGESGSEKSTFLALLQRLYPLDSRKIYFGETDIRFIREASLRNHVASVSQKTNLLAGTIAENIARVLYTDASVLLLDEPTASLDAEAEDKLIAAIRRLRKEEKTIVTAGHRGRLLQIADQTILICKEQLLSSEI